MEDEMTHKPNYFEVYEGKFYGWLDRLRQPIPYQIQKLGIQHLLHEVDTALWEIKRFVDDQIVDEIGSLMWVGA